MISTSLVTQFAGFAISSVTCSVVLIHFTFHILQWSQESAILRRKVIFIIMVPVGVSIVCSIIVLLPEFAVFGEALIEVQLV